MNDKVIAVETLRALSDRWATDRTYTGSPVDDIRALIDEPTASQKPEAVRLRDELRRRAEGCEEEGLGGTADLLRQAAASLEHSMTFARDYKTDDVAVLLDAAASVQPSPAGHAVDLVQLRKLADHWDRITQDKDIKFKDRELIAMYDKGLNKCARELRAALIDSSRAVQS